MRRPIHLLFLRNMSSAANGLPLDLRQLSTFVAVTRTRSFTRAADELGYTRSAVSQQVAALERRLGMPLLERRVGTRPLGPTAAGELLSRHADRMLAGARAIEADFAALAAGTTGRVRVGTFQSAGISILPPLLARFRAYRPHVEIGMHEAITDDELLDRVDEGALELAFCELPLERPAMTAIPLVRDPFVVLVPSDHALARDSAVSRFGQLDGTPLMSYKQPCSLDVALTDAGQAPKIQLHCNETATLHGLVAAGVGFALLPRLAVDRRDDRVTAISLEPLLPPRTLGLAWHADRHRSRACEAFAALAVSVCGELERSFTLPR